MKRLSWVLAAMLFLAVAAHPAQADMVAKAVNTVSNTAFGWLECPKAYADEVNHKTLWRTALGVLVTGPAMCGTNVALRYGGTAVDWVTLPFSWAPGLGKNALNPAVHESTAPPLRLPK